MFEVTSTAPVRAPLPDGVPAFSAELVDARTSAQLATLAKAAPGPLVVLAGSDAELTVAAGWFLASSWVPSTTLTGIDLHRANVDGDRWTVDTLVERVIVPASRAPVGERTVIVVEELDAADPRVLDRLLVLLEEPPATLTVVALVRRVEDVPVTFVGRASAVVECRPASASARLGLLVTRGVPRARAEMVVDLAGDLAVLADLAGPPPAGDIDLLDALDALYGHLPSGLGALDGLDRAVIALASSMTSAKVVLPKELSTAARPAARRVMTRALSVWREMVGMRIRTATSSAEFRYWVGALDALDAAAEQLLRYSPVRTVLSGVLATLTRPAS